MDPNDALDAEPPSPFAAVVTALAVPVPVYVLIIPEGVIFRTLTASQSDINAVLVGVRTIFSGLIRPALVA